MVTDAELAKCILDQEQAIIDRMEAETDVLLEGYTETELKTIQQVVNPILGEDVPTDRIRRVLETTDSASYAHVQPVFSDGSKLTWSGEKLELE